MHTSPVLDWQCQPIWGGRMWACVPVVVKCGSGLNGKTLWLTSETWVRIPLAVKALLLQDARLTGTRRDKHRLRCL